MTHEKIVVELELDDILPNRFQPRIKYPEQAITELAESIKEHGVIQPILVRRIADKYEIIAGERRYKASLLAGKKTIPAIISDLNDKDSAEVALIENVQRQDLTPIEEAVSYRRILDMGYLTQEQLAEKLGKNQSTISNKLRLLNLDDDVQEALLDEKISERHARSLLKLDSKQKQREILNRIITERLTVKKTDELITNILTGKTEQENSSTVEIPSIFMNNSVQVEEPAIQSSSAIEFINPNDQVVNSFSNNNTKDSDLIDFLNVDNNPQSNSNIPVEEITDIPEVNFEQPVQNYTNVVSKPQNFTKFDIPTSPIIEEMEDDINKMPQMYNNTQDLNEIDKMLNNFPNQVNPGFVDVDNIEKNAKDIYVEKPLADIDNLLMSQNGDSNAKTSFEQSNEDIKQEMEEPISQNKFFTMIAPEDTTEENNNENDNSNEEVFNFTPNIENTNTLNQFLNPVENVDASKIEQIPNIEEKNNDINDIFAQPTPFNFEEEVNTTDTFEPAKVENVDPNNFDMQDSIEEIDDIPKTINYPADNNLAESIRKEEIVQTKTNDGDVESKVDLKTIINTIRNCSDTIEKFGYAIECEEYDFEDMYQVIFKIQKKDE